MIYLCNYVLSHASLNNSNRKTDLVHNVDDEFQISIINIPYTITNNKLNEIQIQTKIAEIIIQIY